MATIQFLQRILNVKICLLLLFSAHFSLDVYCQVIDSFEDGDFSNNPQWSGESTKFIVDNGVLRLNDANKTGSAFLGLQSNSIEDATWQLQYDLRFNPSSSNYFDFVIVSDSEELSGSYNGYFVRAGGTNDELSLYRRTGDTVVELIDGEDGKLNMSNPMGSIRVLRDKEGNWQLLADVGNQGFFTSEGIANDLTFVTGIYSGIACKYTSTRSDKFYFDNLEISGNPYADKLVPRLAEFEVLSANEVRLSFSEEIRSGMEEESYVLFPGKHSPATKAYTEAAVTLSFSNDFENGVLSTLLLHSVSDLSGNVMGDTLVNFRYIRQRTNSFRDVIINEVMFDPEPTVQLPASEYVELLNLTAEPIDLGGWQLCDENKCGSVANGYLPPGAYVVMVPQERTADFDQIVSAVGVGNWAAINNSGEQMTLVDATNKLIDSLIFDPGWMETEKRMGGWSLERKDPNYRCFNDLNWSSSHSELGGTPGYANSLNSVEVDLTGPKPVEIWYDSLKGVTIRFDEEILSLNGAKFKMEPPFWANPKIRLENQRVIVIGDEELPVNTLFHVGMGGVQDCVENSSDGKETALLVRTWIAQADELIINEILFHPPPNGVDFVEVLNNSDMYFDLFDYSLGTVTNDTVVRGPRLSSTHQIWSPGELIAFTPSSGTLKNQYPHYAASGFHDVKLVSYSNTEGTVVLSGNQKVIDSVHYHEDWHFELLEDPEGISLERVNGSLPSNRKDNWRSASSISGFGTPGANNSHSFESERNGALSIEPAILLPGNTGDRDLAKIEFDLGNGAWMVTLKAISFGGRTVDHLLNNQWSGSHGEVYWDGIMEDGRKAPIGIYLIYLQAFNDRGETKVLRGKIYIGAEF